MVLGPNTNGSQFSITFAKQPHLSGLYTMFWRATHGFEVMEATPVGPGQKPLAENRETTTCHRTIVEELWRQFFSDPSQWWDHRKEKENTRYPDFKHKKTQQSLWLDGKWNPPWVKQQVAVLAPGTLQLNIFPWNRRLARYVKAGQLKETLKLYQQMEGEGMNLDKFTFIPTLNACAGLRALEDGRRIHAKIIQSHCESDVYVGSSLIDMYTKCGSIEEAWEAFNKMPIRNVVSWNAIIMGHVKCGHSQKALELAKQMPNEGLVPSPATFVGMLNACAGLRALEEGRSIHRQIVQCGHEYDVYVGSSLVDMYAKCGSIEDALTVFNKMPTRNVVSWNAILLGHVKCAKGQKALDLCQNMVQEGIEPDPVTFVALLNACASLAALEQGRRVHDQIIQRSCESHSFVGNSLIDMYAKCGSMGDAWAVFKKMSSPSVVAWNAMILGYVNCGEGHKAVKLSQQMQEEGLEPDPVTFVALLKACASVLSLEEGRRVHERIIQGDCESNVFVAGSLIDMYAKCRSIDDAQRVFDKMPTRDVASWSALILGYVKCGQGQKALELSHEMEQEGVEPDHRTFVGFLNACASVAALDDGRYFHQQIIQGGYETDLFVANSLVDMYAKCGSIEDARSVFEKMHKRDTVAWTSMLGGYALHGLAMEARGHFERMCKECIEINWMTFISLLAACSRAGLVDEGLQYFQMMNSSHSIAAKVEHFACVADLLGRAGRLHEAEEIVKTMSCEPDVTVWMSLLSACTVHGNLEFGERISKEVLKLDPEHAAGYVLLSNIHASAEKWEGNADGQ